MYIRRKVFSIAEDMYGDERYFSTTDIDLGFSDYDDNFYDERLYAEDEEGLSTGAKVGLGVAGAAATTAGALYAAKKGWLGNRAKGWYESGASKLKNMFSKEAKKEVDAGANKAANKTKGTSGKVNNQSRRLNKNTKVDPNAESNSLVSNYSDLVRSGNQEKIAEFKKNFDIEKHALEIEIQNLLKRPGMEGSKELKALQDKLKKLTDTEARFKDVNRAGYNRSRYGGELRQATQEERRQAEKEWLKAEKAAAEDRKRGIERQKIGINDFLRSYGAARGIKFFSRLR
jgi:hypothetical protein